MVRRPDDPLPVIPDDASELEPDRLRWLAEERAKRRRAWFARRLPGRRWSLAELTVPLLAAALTCTCAIAALAVMLTPRPYRGAAAAPPASIPVLTVPATDTGADAPAVETVPGGASGQSPSGAPDPRGPAIRVLPAAVVGRRLPAGILQTDEGQIVIESLRPAVIALLPDACRCPAALTGLFRQAREFRLRLWLVGGGTDTPQHRSELADLSRSATGGSAPWALDGGRLLARALRARGLTVALVQADGMIRQVRRDVTPNGSVPALEPQLLLLLGTRK